MSGLGLDLLTPDTDSAPAPTLGDTFEQGLRVGGISARGQLNTLAGKVMDATGFDGSGRRAAGVEDQRLAQQAGQGLTPLGGVRDVNSGLRWAAGAIGASAPMAALATGASLLGGRGAAGRVLAGTGAMVPFEMGEGLQRMEADPVASQLSPGRQLSQSVAPAAAAALAQNIVPAGVAARLGGHGVSSTGGQIVARGLADIPAEGLAEGAGEGIRQFGLNRVNPNAGYDLEAIKQNAIEGAALGGVFGTVGAAGEAAHKYGRAVAGAPGRAIDAAKGLVPDSVKERAGEALGAAQTGLEGGAERVKAAIDDADVPTKLRGLHERFKTSTASIRDRMAGGQEIADPAELDAAADPAAMGEVFARADKSAMERAKQWGAELMDSGLTPEKAEQVKQWMATAADKASQQGIAALHKGREVAQDVARAVERFARGPQKPGEVVDVEATEVGQPAPQIKKSEVSTEASRALGRAITGVLGEDHPAMSDPELRTKLASGLRSYIDDVANGRAFDSVDKLEQLTALYDVAGDQTTALLNAVHSAVSGAGKDDKAVYKTLNQIDAVMKGRQDVLQTLQKNLRPELQRTSVRRELKDEAEMLSQWARSKTGEPGDVEKAKFNDNQVRSALQMRYGDKADVVMKAVEKSVKAEANMIDEARVKEDGDPNDAGVREGVSEDEIAKSRYYAQKGQLYLSPEKDKGKNGFEGAAAQKLKKAQKDNPNSVVRFVSATELGMDDPAVKAKYADLLDAAETLGMDPDAAKAYADKRIGDFGVVAAEESRQETAITDNELDKVRLDAKRYGDSKSRIDAGEGVILDAARLTEFMQGKLKGDYVLGDDAGRPHRTARMFMEGVAAVQDRLGRSFDIPDSTVIAKNGMTWGEAKKLDARTDADKADDDRTRKLVQLRKEYKRADPEQRLPIKAQAERITAKRDERKDRQLSAEPSSSPDMAAGAMEVDPFGPTFDALGGRGEFKADKKGNLRVVDQGNPKAAIHVNADGSARNDTVMGRRKAAESRRGAKKLPYMGPTTPLEKARREMAAKAADDATSTADDAALAAEASIPAPTAPAADRQAAWVAKALGENLQKFKAAADKLNSEQIDALATFMEDMDGPPEGVPANRFMQARTYVQDRSYNQEAPPSPKVAAAKKAALLKAASSSDPALLKELRSSDDAKGLQRAIAALAEQGDSKALDAAMARLRELVADPSVAYGLQTKKYSLQSDVIHAALGRSGFAATHDSPAKFDGRFDWRTHALKGEGAMVFGAGTYLSTSEGVHKFYKKSFTKKDVALLDAAEHAEYTKLRRAQHEANNAEMAAWRLQKDSPSAENKAAHAEAQKKARAAGNQFGEFVAAHTVETPGPTYHLSVDIEPEQLLDWNKPISEQSETVRAAYERAREEHGVATTEDLYFIPVDDGIWTAETETMDVQIDRIRPDEFVVSTKHFATPSKDPYTKFGSFKTLGEAQRAVNDKLVPAPTGEKFYRALSAELDADADVDNPEASLGDRLASDYLQSLGILGHRMKAAAKDGEQNPNYVIYDDSKIHTNYVHFDRSRTTPGSAGPVDRRAVMDYLQRVHGNSISVAWANILHAGEFERTSLGDVIRLSIHSLNPLSVAYHESLHGFFAKLKDARQTDISAVLEKAGNSAAVMNQLRRLLANEPAALAQLADAEERAAYMYQFWAQGKLTVGPQAQNVFQRIAQFIRQVTGFLTNDERAVQIMEYFHSGQYEATRSNPNAVHQALMSQGAKGTFDKGLKMVQPLRELGESLATAGGARLRDTGIPALRQLADAMKLKGTSEGADPGFLPEARRERSERMNQLGMDLKPYSEAELREALEAMQNGTRPASTRAKIVARIVGRRLDEMLDYMQRAGVKIEHLGMTQGVPYFPRSWDASYISAHQREFLQMLEKYVRSGQIKGDPREIMNTFMVTDGNEFGVEVDKPGMQHAKERVLSFIDHADAAPFMRKDLYQIMNSYITQATRRAEWARRFGDDGKGVTLLLAQAKLQGATPAQMKDAQKFVRAVDGTLGDTINPALRRLQGNVIVYENVRLLPLAIFSSLVDPAGIVVRGGTVGEAFKAFKRGMKEVVKNFQNSPQGDAMTELAAAIGTIDDAALVHAMGASYSQGMVGDTGRKINDTFFRLNLMEQWNSSMRVAATESALQFIARHATRPGDHSARYLRELGLTAADVQIAPSGRTAVLESDGLTHAQAAKMKAAVNRWVDGAVLRPDAVDKPLWMSDPHYALVAHLKQFVFSFHETILKRVVHEAKAGNYTPAMALASYVPMMIAADLLKGIIQGGGQQPPWKDNWTAGDYVWSGMERAGLFGVGQFGIDMLQDAQRGGTGVGALSGPAIEQLVDALQVMGGREQFGPFALKSLPANALYAGLVRGEGSDPDFVK